MPIDAMLNTPMTEVGGWATLTTGCLLQIATAFNIADINPYITGLAGLLGVVFVVYKILNIRLKNKILKKELGDEDEKEN